ncbi:MAG: NAD(P)/FAD-dependent oxidoreductase [Sciscionella sp.]
MAAQATHQVVIVGGGFAGVSTAKQLAADGISVLLIDQHNYHQFQPLIYQVATAQIAVPDVARPLRAIFRGDPVEVKTATVAAVDAESRTVTTADGLTYRGEILVLATGGEANFFDIPGAAEHAFPLYSVDDAARLRSRLLGALDTADRSQDYIDRGVLNVVIVGAGPTGVETAGAVAESLRYVVPSYLPTSVATQGNVYLVDMIPTVLAAFTERSQEYAKRKLRSSGVQLRLDVGVTEVRKDGVVLADGSHIPSKTVVWAGGLKAGRLIANTGLPQGKGGRIDVDPDLRAPGFPGVYVLGDSANLTDAAGNHLPQLGSVAQQAGKWAARNIKADLAGAPRQPFKYQDKGIMAMIGRGAAVAELGSKHRQMAGVVAFAAWLGVHLVLLSGLRERIGACVSWIWDYLSRRRPQILVDRPEAYAIDWEDDSGLGGR